MISNRRVGSYLSYVVEVSMWNFLLRCQLLHLIQKNVHLEFRAEVLQATVAEGLSVAQRNINKKLALSERH